jgi:hypothetical protein
LISGHSARAFAAGQWLLAAALFGVATRARSTRSQLLLAPIAIVGVALLFYLTVYLLNFTVQADLF